MRLSHAFWLCALLLAVRGAESSPSGCPDGVISTNSRICQWFGASSVSCGSGFVKWVRGDCGCGCKSVVCGAGEKTCPDGSIVVEDPNNNCAFPKCPSSSCPPKEWTRAPVEGCWRPCKPGYKYWSHEDCGCGCEPIVCKKGEKKCPDGSLVVRNPTQNCDFPKCECPPKGWVEMESEDSCKLRKWRDCPLNYGFKSAGECGCGCQPQIRVHCQPGVEVCPDGTVVERDPERGCAFRDCPPVTTVAACKSDEKTCPDGSTVARDPAKNCDFPKCECPPKVWTRTPEMCNQRLFVPCELGYKFWSHEDCGCGCEPVGCKKGEKTCPDGSTVVRDVANNCKWQKCNCRPRGWTRFGGPKKCGRKGDKLTCGPGYERWTHKKCGCGCKPVGAGAA